ncbi:hypothetical protein [Caulobacter sp. 17J65-9]|uniref:hypothetical protein n=1 Tax=Caulobacter sp. 17J65-9 TaxID=2709382 RepID=UPI0013C7E660|nr:hypothetical protein [Caulobacter sp. 17J65-9]NEX91370.1 hypothetical protein [Caulobacter sp. 17J65-9]
MELWWVPAVAGGAMAIGAWSLWLEHKRKDKALDVLKDAVAQGRDLPPVVIEQLARIGGGTSPAGYGHGDPSNQFGAWQNVIMFLFMAAAFGAASWWGGGPGTPVGLAFASVSAAMGVSGLGSLLAALTRKRR